MSLVRNLLQSSQDMVDTSDLEKSFGVIHEGFLDDAMVSLMEGICEVDRAYYTADIIGSCRVVTEGADPAVVMENVIKSGIDKLINLWKEALAKVKAFFNKMVQFVKSMILTGKKFVDEYGATIRQRVAETKNFSMPYKGYKYDLEGGNSLANTYMDAISRQMDADTGVLSEAATKSAEEIMAKVGNKSEAERVSAEDHLETVIKAATGGNCSSVGEMVDALKEKYHGGDTSTGEHTLTAGEVGDMLDEIGKSKTTLDNLTRARKSMENKCNNVIRKLQSIQKPKDGESEDKYQTASTISKWLNMQLSAYKTIANTQINMSKETITAYTRLMRKVLNRSSKKLTSESTLLFEGTELEDADFDDDFEVDEAAIAGADEPEGDTNDIGIVKEGCGKKCATEEGCSTDKDPLEEAMMYL